MNNFEDLIIWQEGGKLFDDLYKIFGDNTFKHYYFKEQILGAALSVSNNIAEGYETKTSNERKQFINYAKRSCGEVRNMIYRAYNCKIINKTQFSVFLEQTKKLSIMIYKFGLTIK